MVNRREEIIKQIEEQGGFSVFWAGEIIDRARILDGMIKSGEIIVTPRQYPWSTAVFKEPKK